MWHRWFRILCTSFFCCISPQCLVCVSIGAICWGKGVVRNGESEMAAKRRSPSGTSSVITPGIPLCRPWTLTSQSTLGNHLPPHTSQNKDCRGFCDAHSWHTELTVNWTLHSRMFHINSQCWKSGRREIGKSDLICAEISVADLLLTFTLMSAYH